MGKPLLLVGVTLPRNMLIHYRHGRLLETPGASSRAEDDPGSMVPLCSLSPCVSFDDPRDIGKVSNLYTPGPAQLDMLNRSTPVIS